MIISIASWIYVFITSFIVGSFILRRTVNLRNLNTGCYTMGGICILTVYAGYYSLITGVGMVANLIMLAACLVFVIVDRIFYLDEIAKLRALITGKRNLFRLVIAVIIILACAYFTSYGRFAYDTGTYHAQSIHWIETYGVVKGLAYMQTRLGFNSSYFCLCALYSFHDITKSLHTLSGFLAAFTMIYSLNGLFDRESISLRVKDFIYLAPFIYFVIIAIELVSPTTDFVTIWMIIWLCTRWTELMEGEADNTEYCLLCIMAVFLVSIKLSVGVLAILVIKPAIKLIKDKDWKHIIAYIVIGIAMILPYFIRNILITGWLIYPLPAVDLFDFDWKIPLSGVQQEADEIVVWARYTKDTALIDQSIKEWFPIWWQEQGPANRYLSMAAFVAAAAVFLRIVLTLTYRLVLSVKQHQNFNHEISVEIKKQSRYVYFMSILLISFLFFMITAPSNRFGYGYIIMLPLLIAGDLIINVICKLPEYIINICKEEKIKEKITVLCNNVIYKGICYTVCLFVALVLAYPMLKGLHLDAYDDYQYAMENLTSEYIVYPKDYPKAESEKREWEGITISYPVVEGEQIWYYDFPAILYGGNLDGIERRGDTIQDGFRLRQ